MSRRQLALLALIVVAAVAARVCHIGAASLWLDEQISLESSAGMGLTHLRLPSKVVLDPPPDVLALGPASRWVHVPVMLAHHDNHPPLYFLILRAWRTLFGDSEVALRSLSALIGTIAILLLFDAVQKAHGSAVGLWSAAIMALAIPSVQYSQEVRGYILGICFGCGLLDAVVRIETLGPSPRRIVAGATCALGMALTHYYTLGPLLAVAAYALIVLRGPARRGVIAALLLAGAAFVLLWGWPLVVQLRNVAGNNQYLVEPAEGHVALTWRRLMLLPLSFLNEPMRGLSAAAVIGAILLLLLPPLAARRQRVMLLWWMWLIGSIGVVLAMDLARTSKQLDFIRYTVIAAPAVYAILAAIGVSAKSPWLRHAIPAAALLSCAISLPRAYAYYTPPKPQWRALGTALSSRAGTHDLVLFWLHANPGHTRNQYVGLLYYARPMLGQVAFIDAPPDPAIRAAMDSASNVWLVLIEDDPPEWATREFNLERMPYYPQLPGVFRLARSGGDTRGGG
jgi:uncharacterized membrane protein